MAHPGGRPSEYDQKFCQMLADAMQSGLSVKRFCKKTRIGRTSFYKWLKEYPEFANTFYDGEWDRDAHWEELGANNLENKDFNVNLYKFMNFLACGISENKPEEKVELKDTVDKKSDEAIAEINRAKEAYKAAMKKEY